MCSRFLADRSGATSIEYAIIAGFLSLVVLPGFSVAARAILDNGHGALRNGW